VFQNSNIETMGRPSLSLPTTTVIRIASAFLPKAKHCSSDRPIAGDLRPQYAFLDRRSSVGCRACKEDEILVWIRDDKGSGTPGPFFSAGWKGTVQIVGVFLSSGDQRERGSLGSVSSRCRKNIRLLKRPR
jgi:hypothetical protein